VSLPILVSWPALSLSRSLSLSLLPWTPTTNYTASHPIPQDGQIHSNFTVTSLRTSNCTLSNPIGPDGSTSRPALGPTQPPAV
jgi:hypothetical protein